jgi:hypothetical protein
LHNLEIFLKILSAVDAKISGDFRRKTAIGALKDFQICGILTNMGPEYHVSEGPPACAERSALSPQLTSGQRDRGWGCADSVTRSAILCHGSGRRVRDRTVVPRSRVTACSVRVSPPPWRSGRSIGGNPRSSPPSHPPGKNRGGKRHGRHRPLPPRAAGEGVQRLEAGTHRPLSYPRPLPPRAAGEGVPQLAPGSPAGQAGRGPMSVNLATPEKKSEMPR